MNFQSRSLQEESLGLIILDLSNTCCFISGFTVYEANCTNGFNYAILKKNLQHISVQV